MIAVLIFLLVLSTLVLGHEFGHYLAARICGVKAEEFGWGFPPRAIGFVRQRGKWKRIKAGDQQSYPRTIWSLNWLPLGGFVRLKGEEGTTAGETDSFLSKKAPAKIFILVAGVLMNWVMAAMIFSVGFLVGIPAQTDGLPANAIIRDRQVQVAEVPAESAAGKAGLKPGDFISAVDGKTVQTLAMVQHEIELRSGEKRNVELKIQTKQGERALSFELEYVAELHRSGLGVYLADTGIVRFPWYAAIGQGVVVTWNYTKMVFGGFGRLVTDLVVRHEVSEGLSGPVGIAVLTSRITEQGVWSVAQFAALLSLNLAVINILPIPALDGGRVLFILLESLRRRSNQRFEAMIHRVGFIVLLILIFLVTIHDVRQYGAVIWQGIRHVAGF